MSSARRDVVIALIGSREWREAARRAIGPLECRIVDADTPDDGIGGAERPNLFVVRAAPAAIRRCRELMAGIVPMPFVIAARSSGVRAASLLSAGADAVVADAATTLLVEQVRAGLRRTNRQTEFFEKAQAVAREASTDPLTGLPNRRTFTDALAAEIARAHRHHRPLSLALIDIDHFKDVNDRHGHPAGDRVLAAVARRLSSRHRAAEMVARIGGEEFAWLLPETTENAAVEACERSRAAISAMDMGAIGAITISVGVATLTDGEPPSGLMDRADRALYVAKQSGRDRVVSTVSERAPSPRAADGDAVLAYLGAAERHDQAAVMRIASRRIDEEGLVGLCQNLLQPALDEVGRRWECGEMSVATEHLVTGLSERLLNEFPIGGADAEGPLIVLAGAPRNGHRLGLLAASELLSSLGWRPVLLGAHTPIEGLAEISLRLDAPVVGLSVGTSGDLRGLTRQLETLIDALPGRTILVGGNAIRRAPRWAPPEGARAVRGAVETVSVARELREALAQPAA